MATYKKTGGFATTEGQDLEVKMCALLLLRGLSSRLDFQLATNVGGAGALDDIVFRFKPPDSDKVQWTTCFVQTKHKQKLVLKPDNFTGTSGDFALSKYFKSYETIKAAMAAESIDQGELMDGNIENAVFVIFTNAKPGLSMGEGRRQADGRTESFLSTGADGSIFDLSPGSHAMIDEAMRELGSEGETFRKQLKLFCGQQSVAGLDDSIRAELAKLRVESTELDSVFKTFLLLVKGWWEMKGTDVAILSGDGMLVRAINRVSVEKCSLREKEKFSLDVRFQDDTLSTLREVLTSVNNSLLHVEASEKMCRFTGTKLLEVFKESQFLLFGIKYFLENLGSVLSVWEKDESKTLVVIMPEPDVPIGGSFEEVAEKMCAILSVPGSERRAVIVSRETNNLTEKLSASLGNRFQRVQDTFEFSQVGELHYKTFTFQGFHVSVEEFLNTISDDGLKCEFLLNVIDTKGSVKVGPVLDNDLTYFIPRTLESCTLLKFGILQEGLSLTVVYSSAEDLQKILSEFDAKNTNQSFEETLKTISRSGFVPDEVNEAVCCSKTCRLGSYDFSRIVLRNGQADEVTALRIRPSKDDSNQRWFLFVGETVDKEDVATLSRFNNSEHCLRLAGGKLRWTSTSTGNMDVICRHLDETTAASLRPKTVADVEDRVVLICAEPGMGKSTLATHLAWSTKHADPGTWLIKLALNDNTKLFKDGVHLNCLKFLLAAAKIGSVLDKMLFKNALESSGNVCILLDGFDEIAPRYANECCVLLANLIKTKTRNIWLTSRNTMKEKLENSLITLSNKLRKFDEDDQRNFLKKYWKDESTLSEDELEKVIESLVEMTSRAISDRERNLMGVPLQTKMIADVYKHLVTHPASTTTLPEKLNLLDLLDKFFQTKLDIYAEGKLGLKDDATDYDDRVEEIKLKTTKDLMQAALIAILSIDDLRSLDSFETIIKKSSCFFKRIRSGQDKTGIIDSMVNDKPRFVHRVYAEYFVAKWFADNFSEGIVVLRRKLFTANLSVVRDILDRILAEKDGCQLHSAVLNGDLQQAETLLSDRIVDVNARDLGGRTALHLAAAFGEIQDLEEVTRCREMLDLLIRRKEVDLNQEDKILLTTPLSYADMSSSLIAVDKLLACNADSKHLVKTRTNIEDSKLLKYAVSHDLDALVGFYLEATGRHVDSNVDIGNYYPLRLLLVACGAGSLRTATLLVERGADIDKLDLEVQSPLHIACQAGHLPVVEMLLSAGVKAVVGEDPDKESRKIAVAELINKKNRLGDNPLVLAARGNQPDVVSFLIDQGADLLTSNKLLIEAAGHETPNTLNVLLAAFPEAERAAYVNSCSEDGNTAVHTAASEGRNVTLDLLLNTGGKLGPAGVRKKTVLMAAASGELDTVTHILNLVDAHNASGGAGGSREDLGDRLHFINLQDSDGRTALHYSVLFGRNLHVTRYLLDQGADVRIRDREGRTPLYFAALRTRVDVLCVLLGAVSETERAAYIMAGDNHGWSALHLAGYHGHPGVVICLLDALSKTERAAYIMAGDNHGWSALHLAARNGHLDVVTCLLDALGNIERVAYIMAGNDDGRSALHQAALNGHLDVVTCLLDALSKTERVAYIMAGNNHGSSALHLAAELRHPDVATCLLGSLSETERELLVNACDKDGDSVLHCAALGGCLESVDLVLNAGGKLLSKNLAGRTPSMSAAKRGRYLVVVRLFDYLDEGREGISKLDYVKLRDSEGFNVFDLMEQAGPDCLAELVTCLAHFFDQL